MTYVTLALCPDPPSCVERGASLEMQQLSYKHEHKVDMLQIAKQEDWLPWAVSVVGIYAPYSTLDLMFAHVCFLHLTRQKMRNSVIFWTQQVLITLI